MRTISLIKCGWFLAGYIALRASDCPCSEPAPLTCVTAGTVIWTDPLAIFSQCASTIAINNTVTGYYCASNPSGYKMIEVVAPNWVSETKFTRQWVGNAQAGFCKVTTTSLNGQNYDCKNCVPCEFPAEKCNPG